MNRTQAREYVMQMVFQIEAQHDWENTDIKKYSQSQPVSNANLGKQKDYVEDLLTAVCDNLTAIDEAINNASTSWKTSRMAKSDLAVARVGACEIMYFNDIPEAVAINEAVDLAKKYGTDQSAAFINAILGKIKK